MSGGGSFFERIDRLAEQVGHGTLRGRVVVDQVYAHYQHEGTEFAHPRGGQAHFLRDPLFEGSDKRMEHLASKLLTPDGSEIREGMIDAAETLSDDVERFAPVEHGNLRNSGHPIVYDDGAVIHDRPPHVHRLSEAELKSEHRRAHAARQGELRRAEHQARRSAP